MTVKVYAADREQAQKAAKACEQCVENLDALLAPENPKSDIGRLNVSNGNATAVSPLTYFLVKQSLDIAQKTDAAFDPTIYPLTCAWGFTSGNHRIPTQEDICSLKSCVNFSHVKTNAEDNTITLEGDAQIDLGGIAKGYAADCLTTLLKNDYHIDIALLDLGGNITTIGTKPDNTSWNIGIADPLAPDTVAGTLRLHDVTVSTSGAYQRYFVGEDGQTYHHIIDPSTGYPADSDLISVSVIGTNATSCDALSTALYVMGYARARTFCLENDDIQAVLITRDGTIHLTAGLAELFTPSETYAKKTVVESL